MTRHVTGVSQRRIERWFVRQGVPTMIENYGFVDDVLPRMLPNMLFVAIASLVWLVPLKSAGSGRWVWLGVVVAVTVAVRAAMALFVRRMPQLSPRVTAASIAAYSAMPVVVPLLQLAVDGTVTPPGGAFIGFLGFAAFFALGFAATFVATVYSLGALLRRAIRGTLFDLRNSVQLLGRALPMLLFATLFLFFTGELWQAMNRLHWWRLSAVVALFGVVTVLASAARLRDEIDRVEQDLSAERLSAAASGTPLADAPVDELVPDGHLPTIPLNGRQERNLLLMLATRQLMQAAVVGLALFLFFIALGLLVVTPDTAEQWIGVIPTPSGLFPSIPAALFKNATLFGGFGCMYFAVISMSDADHRHRFFAPVVDEIERVLAVRALYLASADMVWPSASR
ncbi:hypothetical protein [Nocardia sp. CA-120079]|uniref:hypothetical protein n=1 Tax=Nocardia sp. CA-120079 TaxID=3239974 RepID=UPI003D9523B2